MYLLDQRLGEVAANTVGATINKTKTNERISLF